MAYFENFGKILYDPSGNGNPKVVTNIMSRVRMRTNMKKNVVMLDPYDVQENETPEIIADRHHGSPHYHWVVMLLNNISDVHHDWPKSTRQIQKYISTKYTSAQLEEVHHYEIAQTSGDTTVKIEVENTTYPGASPVSNLEYETALNEEKRKIDLLRNDYLGLFTEEFANLV